MHYSMSRKHLFSDKIVENFGTKYDPDIRKVRTPCSHALFLQNKDDNFWIFWTIGAVELHRLYF